MGQWLTPERPGDFVTRWLWARGLTRGGVATYLSAYTGAEWGDDPRLVWGAVVTGGRKLQRPA